MADKQPVATFITQSENFLRSCHSFYKQLNTSRREIRLMHIKPGRHEEPINLELKVVDLVDGPFYESISYTWEAMVPTKQVYIHGLAYNVTVNQHAVLRHLRSLSETRIMWMDVICINQVDLEERSHQVSIMGDVYAHAARTVIWLGELDADWDMGLTDEEWEKINAEFDENRRLSSIFKIPSSSQRDELMRDFLTIDDIVERANFIVRRLAADQHMTDFPFCTLVDGSPLLCRQWYEAVNMLIWILRRPWWTRVWVLQEVFLCRGDPMLMFGSFELPFRLFVDATRTLTKHIAIDRCCLETFGPVFIPIEFLDRMLEMVALSLTPSMDKPGHMALNKAIQLTQRRNATDVRDHVYGLLGLVQPEDRVKVDYRLTTKQVFASTSWHIIKTRNTLSWLVHGALQGGTRTEGISTWSVDWAEVDRLAFRHNDSWAMDETPDWEKTKYGGNLELLANHITEIRVVLDRVEHNEDLSDCFNHYTRLWSWIKALQEAGSGIRIASRSGGDYSTNKSFLSLFGTLFRDTFASMDSLSSIIVRRLGGEDWETISKWWDELNKCMEEGTEQQYPSMDLANISISFVLSTQDYTLALTTENNLCLVPVNSTVGDLLYHVRACCPPLVLRTAGENAFHVVGPAYLYRSMGSEGWSKANEKVITLE